MGSHNDCSGADQECRIFRQFPELLAKRRHATHQAPQTISFLDLPYDIRYRIYTFFLLGLTLAIDDGHEHKSRSRDSSLLVSFEYKSCDLNEDQSHLESLAPRILDVHAGLRLLRLCKPIQDEAIRIFYQNRILTLGPRAWDQLDQFLFERGKQRSSFIRHLVLSVPGPKDLDSRGCWAKFWPQRQIGDSKSRRGAFNVAVQRLGNVGGLRKLELILPNDFTLMEGRETNSKWLFSDGTLDFVAKNAEDQFCHGNGTGACGLKVEKDIRKKIMKAKGDGTKEARRHLRAYDCLHEKYHAVDWFWEGIDWLRQQMPELEVSLVVMHRDLEPKSSWEMLFLKEKLKLHDWSIYRAQEKGWKIGHVRHGKSRKMGFVINYDGDVMEGRIPGWQMPTAESLFASPWGQDLEL